MDDGIGLAEALLGLEGFRVLDVTEGPDELSSWKPTPRCSDAVAAVSQTAVGDREMTIRASEATAT